MVIFIKNVLLFLLTSLWATSIYSMNTSQANRHGNDGTIQELIDRGVISSSADINLQNPLGMTKLHAYAAGGDLRVVQLLIAAGAKVNQQENNLWCPLHHAASSGHLEVSQTLIASGAALNPKDELGRAPLHLAACNGHQAVAQLLIVSGANANQLDNLGRAPLQIATARGHQEIVDLINRVNASTDIANKQLLAFLSAAHPRLGAASPVQSVVQDTQTNGLAHIIGQFVRQAALEDVVYQQHNH